MWWVVGGVGGGGGGVWGGHSQRVGRCGRTRGGKDRQGRVRVFSSTTQKTLEDGRVWRIRCVMGGEGSERIGGRCLAGE